MLNPVDGTPIYKRPEDNPNNWWGLFYFNPGDQRLWVLKRTRLGWTLNFARPAAWAVATAIIGLIAAARCIPGLRAH